MFESIIQQKTRPSKAFYPWPGPCYSAEDFDRFYNLDIDGMTDFERWQEINRIEHLLAWLDNGEILIVLDGRVITRRAWLMERLAKLRRREGTKKK